jgi:hypothetical protein
MGGVPKNRDVIAGSRLRYAGDIMMSRMQITLEPEIRRRARQRASSMGISLTEYVRRLIARDLGATRPAATPAVVFDLGSSGGSDVAANKDAMLAEAFARGTGVLP